jgi:hypothetical protein
VHSKKKEPIHGEASPRRSVRALRCPEIPVKMFSEFARIRKAAAAKRKTFWTGHQAPSSVKPPPTISSSSSATASSVVLLIS